MQLSSHTIKVRLIAHPASFQKSKIQVYSRVGRNLILSKFEQVRDIISLKSDSLSLLRESGTRKTTLRATTTISALHNHKHLIRQSEETSYRIGRGTD